MNAPTTALLRSVRAARESEWQSFQASRQSTPTGIPIVDCETCGHRHPVSRSHCVRCNVASVFRNAEGVCLVCIGGGPE